MVKTGYWVLMDSFYCFLSFSICLEISMVIVLERRLLNLYDFHMSSLAITEAILILNFPA